MVLKSSVYLFYNTDCSISSRANCVAGWIPQAAESGMEFSVQEVYLGVALGSTPVEKIRKQEGAGEGDKP